MDIRQIYSVGGLDKLLTEMEAAIKLHGKDYMESSYDTILRNIKQRINKEYQIDLNLGKINDISFETGIYRSAVALFLDVMAMVHSKLCAYCQICRYMTHNDISLSSINYMSYTQESMKKILKALQREKTMVMAEESIEMMKTKIMTIKTSNEKRLFMLLLLSWDIGLYELVAVIAEILFLGGYL